MFSAPTALLKGMLYLAHYTGDSLVVWMKVS